MGKPGMKVGAVRARCEAGNLSPRAVRDFTTPYQMDHKEWARAYFRGKRPGLPPGLYEATGEILGERNEHLVVEGLRALHLRWIFGVRKALPEEDRAGWDVVVLTRDCGALRLQVKSSQDGARIWAEEHPDLVGEVGGAVLRANDGPAEAAMRALGTLILMREERLP